MRNSKFGVSLLEILVAGFILCLGIIPLYRALSGQSAAEIETTKFAMAKEILTSVRQEILAHTFAEMKNLVPTGTGGGILTGQPYPIALTKVLNAQTKFKDFELEVRGTFTDSTQTMIQYTAEIKFTSQGGKIQKEVLPFMQISPN
ncbi:MAG TPA: hypothetical protein PKO06_21465 [Candidatus Ozemobacteraceae bacterium]|nr:hypothetical protein [Candidatus Ozemobacteraceae bacterium]